jgi:Fe-S-cluster-containing dehydrogenase component
MQKRSVDGIVFIDKDLCVGCKTCVSACPWGAPQWNSETGKVEKCDYCKDRVDQGLNPACVTTCTTGCLKFGNVEEMTQVRRERHAASVASLENSSF